MALQDALGYDGKTYSGQEFRLMVASLTGGRGGVSKVADYVATPQGSPNNTVSVAAGTAIIPADHAGDLGSYEVSNDAALTSPTFAATGANPRKDLLILRVTAGVAALEVVQGTAAGSPVYPTVTGDNYIVICGVSMPANKSIIDNGTNGTIEDRRSLWPTTVICTSTTRPPIPFEGQRIYETDTDKELIYDNATWVETEDLGAWDTWAPSWTNVTVGNATIVAKYRKRGRSVEFRLRYTHGSTSSVTGLIEFSLPVAALGGVGEQGASGVWSNNAGSSRKILWADFPSATNGSIVFFVLIEGGNVLDATHPAAWATGDNFKLEGTYESLT